MGYPAGEKYGAGGFGQIERIKIKWSEEQIIPNMVERHDDHDGTAQEINGGDPLFCDGLGQIHIRR